MTTKREREAEQRLEELHETLVAKTAELTTSEGWLAWLNVAKRFHRYSLNNQLLIWAQCPTATHVAGFRVWEGLGRNVVKGQKSLKILAPSTRKIRKEDATTGEDVERRIVTGFRAASVFDVSQTEGTALPEQVLPELLDGQAPEGLWASLALLADAHGYTVERGDCGGANGYTDPATMTVRVREDVSDAQAVKTLVHEVAHVMLHTSERSLTEDAIKHRHIAEVEAESVAYLISTSHGLPSDAYTLPYVAGWSNGKPEVVAATADRVLKAAKQILAVTQAEEPAAAA